MRTLFLADDYLDYVSDPLYISLSRVLGNERVVDYPYKPCFHDPEASPWYLVQRSGHEVGYGYTRSIASCNRKSLRGKYGKSRLCLVWDG